MGTYYIDAEQKVKPISSNLQVMLEGTYIIPDLQRDFEWNKKALHKLWKDILKTFELNISEDGDIVDKHKMKPHFMGAFVVLKRQPSEHGEKVIDGQQRLTSFYMILSVLLDKVNKFVEPKLRSKLASSVVQTLLHTGGGKNHPRLEHWREKEFFEHSVITYETMEEKEAYWDSEVLENRPVALRMKDAITWLDQWISEFLDAGGTINKQKKIERLIDIIKEFFICLKITAEDAHDAYNIFECLNYRGTRLTDADLVKMHVFRIADEEGNYEQVVKKWRQMLEKFENQKKYHLNELLLLHYISTYGDATETTTFTKVSETVGNGTLTALKYVTDLSKNVDHLIKCLNMPAAEFNAAIRDHLEDLNKILNLKYSLPLQLAAMDRFEKDKSQLEVSLRNINNFCFRFFKVQGVSVERFTKVAGEASRALRNPEKKFSDVLAILHKHSPNDEFKLKFETISIKTPKVSFYVIWRIENFIAKGAGLSVYKQGYKQHLEHIMPQDPGTSWKEIHDSDPAKYEEHIYKLGNLLVLEGKINSAIKNYTFYKKKEAYKDSALKLPKDDVILKKDEWCFDEIVQRQQYLATKYCCDVWKLD